MFGRLEDKQIATIAPKKWGTVEYLSECFQSAGRSSSTLLKSAKHILFPGDPLPDFNAPLKIDEIYKQQTLRQRICQAWNQVIYTIIDLAFINQEGIQFYHNPSRVTLIPIFKSYTFIGLCIGVSYFYGLATGVYLFVLSYLFIVALKMSFHETSLKN